MKVEHIAPLIEHHSLNPRISHKSSAESSCIFQDVLLVLNSLLAVVQISVIQA